MMKNLIKSTIVKPFNLIGYDVTFSKKTNSKRAKQSIISVDKNVWEPYFIPNNKIQLYFKGLKQSHVEWSDNFYKQLRFYSLQQIVYYILRQELIGDFVEYGVWKGHSAYIISYILSENKFTGDFHIFDSFEGGLSDKVEKDKNLRFELSEKQIQAELNIFHSTEDEVKSCLSSFQFTHLYKG